MMEEFDDQKSTRGIADYWAMVGRRKWWIVGPLFFGWLLVFLSAWVIPADYTSEAVILVEQQKVPEHYVMPNVQVDLGERLQAITQQVLSRTRLLNIINSQHLYQSFLTPSPDDQIRRMRKDIKIDLVETPSANGNRQELTAFKISYTSPKPSVAQQVNTQLASFFIDENVRASQQQSESTTQFLDAQLKTAAANLAEQEAKLRDYQKKHMGDLPSEMQGNIQMLASIQQQMQNAQEARNHALQQQAYLTSLATQYEAMGVDNLSSSSPQSIDQQIESAKAGLADARAKYTDDHPDIKKLKDAIAKLEELKKQQDADKAAASQKHSDAAAGTNTDAKADTTAERPGTTSEKLSAMTPVMQIQSQLKANKLEIRDRENEIKRLEAKAAAYQAHLGNMPATQVEMSELARDYEQTKKNYDELLGKKMNSSLATNLERQQQGEQFRVIDPPSLPEKASFPDRFKFSLAGLAVGIGLAVLFGAGSEVLDDRIRSEQDLAEASPLPVLVEIPPLPTAQEIAAERWRPWIAVAAAVLAAIIIPTGILYAFYWG